MPILGLLLLFIALPLVELYVIYKVGDAIGILPTILLLAADSVLGSLLLRSQGRAVWRRFNEAMSAGRMPHREVQHGVAVIFGGALLITPGFLTDILGLALLLPPTRALLIRLVSRSLARRVERRAAEAVAGRDRPASHPYDVEGTATERPPSTPPRLER